MGYRLLPWHSEYYHGKPRSRPFFEGWYFRHSARDGSQTIAVIPGIARGINEDEDQAFIQIIRGPEAQSWYIPYPAREFQSLEAPFRLSVGQSSFSLQGIELDIDRPELKLKGRLDFGEILPVRTSILAPSIMGPFAFLPGMQCNHGILSLHHQVNGQLTLEGSKLILDNGSGYIEKDWGCEFPGSWLWAHANKTNKGGQPSSFSCSIASIPYHGINFTGLIAVYLKDGTEYRFTTYGGGKAGDIVLTDRGFAYTLFNRRYSLQVKATVNKQASLKAPAKGAMKRDILEDTDGRLDIKLCRNEEVVAQEVFEHAAIEMADAEKLAQEVKAGIPDSPK